jgi:hypothetical protein
MVVVGMVVVGMVVPVRDLAGVPVGVLAEIVAGALTAADGLAVPPA